MLRSFHSVADRKRTPARPRRRGHAVLMELSGRPTRRTVSTRAVHGSTQCCFGGVKWRGTPRSENTELHRPLTTPSVPRLKRATLNEEIRTVANFVSRDELAFLLQTPLGVSQARVLERNGCAFRAGVCRCCDSCLRIAVCDSFRACRTRNGAASIARLESTFLHSSEGCSRQSY